MATVTEFTALSIYLYYLRFVRKRCRLDQLIVGGGGVHNLYLMRSLGKYFHPAEVTAAAAGGITPDAKEAAAFALLAYRTVTGQAGNIPASTGARTSTTLGVICPP